MNKRELTALLGGWEGYVLGIGLHSFIDGIIYAITFTFSLFTGVLAGAGMVLHEFPEGIITYMLLLRSGFGEHKSLVLAFCAAALSTPLGTLVALPFVSQISQPVLGALLALSAVGAGLCRCEPSFTSGRTRAKKVQPRRPGWRNPGGRRVAMSESLAAHNDKMKLAIMMEVVCFTFSASHRPIDRTVWSCPFGERWVQ